ncbi:MAG: prolyl oligopeptidase family serine peptidase [Aureliella sp.]
MKMCRRPFKLLDCHTARRPLVLLTIFICLLRCTYAFGDGPSDNDPSQVRQVPPRGIELPADVRGELLQRAEAIDAAASSVDEADPIVLAWVRVIPRAIRMSVETEMFYKQQDINAARMLLTEGERRAAALSAGKSLQELLSPRDTPNGPQLAVGGFTSKIDQSIQPFGLVLPKGAAVESAAAGGGLRLDVWLHGRGEKVSESAFLHQRLTRVGEYAPENTIVLHPYGRYSNAFKFAGEIDVIEAIEHVKQVLPIDPSKITIRGFSMGGAGCWQMAVHYPDLWAAANPGAGFSETRQFLEVFQGEKYDPKGYARDLLHWYDCPDWVNNLRNFPTVAYSGEIDRQKQAADVMASAFQSEGLELPHIIGPNTAHKIHADAKIEIEAFMANAVDSRPDQQDGPIDLTTYTLRYNKLRWLRLTGLVEHWKQSRVQGHKSGAAYTLTTQNVSGLQVIVPPGEGTLTAAVTIDGSKFTYALSRNEVRYGAIIVFHRVENSNWQIGASPAGLAKRPGLQGPIDDAFMDAFVFVGPDETDGASTVDRWVGNEFQHATGEWRRHMRGDVNALSPNEVTEEIIANNNLVLFGTPESNTLIREVIDALPFDWTSETIQIGQHSADAGHSVIVAIYPNPLNPSKYVVLNSGFTYREYAYLNNARQVPMLPDWAVVDVREGATTQLPGKIQAAGFFDESWRVK